MRFFYPAPSWSVVILTPVILVLLLALALAQQPAPQLSPSQVAIQMSTIIGQWAQQLESQQQQLAQAQAEIAKLQARIKELEAKPEVKK